MIKECMEPPAAVTTPRAKGEGREPILEPRRKELCTADYLERSSDLLSRDTVSPR